MLAFSRRYEVVDYEDPRLASNSFNPQAVLLEINCGSSRALTYSIIIFIDRTVIDLHNDECGERCPYLQNDASKPLLPFRTNKGPTNKKPKAFLAKPKLDPFFLLHWRLKDSKMSLAFMGNCSTRKPTLKKLESVSAEPPGLWPGPLPRTKPGHPEGPDDNAMGCRNNRRL